MSKSSGQTILTPNILILTFLSMAILALLWAVTSEVSESSILIKSLFGAAFLAAIPFAMIFHTWRTIAIAGTFLVTAVFVPPLFRDQAAITHFAIVKNESSMLAKELFNDLVDGQNMNSIYGVNTPMCWVFFTIDDLGCPVSKEMERLLAEYYQDLDPKRRSELRPSLGDLQVSTNININESLPTIATFQLELEAGPDGLSSLTLARTQYRYDFDSSELTRIPTR